MTTAYKSGLNAKGNNGLLKLPRRQSRTKHNPLTIASLGDNLL